MDENKNNKSAEDKERIEALAEWRKSNWKKILKKNQKVLESIRDDPEAKDKDKIEAAKLLARMADIITPERITTASTTPKKKQLNWWEQELSSEETEALNALLDSAK